MIVDLGEFRGKRRPVYDGSRTKDTTVGVMSVEAAACGQQMSDSQIFDLEHHRRLKALHTHLEGGATLSEAARRVGVSHLTAYRWNDHGRR